MKFVNALGNLVGYFPFNDLLYRACRRYVNHHLGDNNAQLKNNGELRLLRQVLPTSLVVFDVGANVGDWSELALTINPNLQIHCFEPSRAAFKILQQRGLVGLVRFNNLGLSAIAENGTMHLFSEGAGANSLYRREGLDETQSQTEEVRLDTLDAYCDRNGIDYIDLLKLDVEGHELNVLKGALKMIELGRIRRIQFEYGGTYIDARILLKDMFQLLASFGYSLYKIYPNSLRLHLDYDQALENFQYQNWIAVRH